MYRILLHIGSFTVYSYGFMLALAFILGTALAQRRSRAQKIDENKIMDLSLAILVASIIGARAFFIAINWQYYRIHAQDIFKIWEGGLVFYGGFILAFFVAMWFMRKNGLPVWKVADIMAPSVALGIALGRIGCFLNGCCYGALSKQWGISFPGKDNPPVFAQQVADGLISPAAACSLPVLPVQLYFALHGLIIFAVLLFMERYKRFDGFIFWILVILYSAGRFFIEGIRYYEPAYIIGGLTVSQVISAGLFILAISVLIARSKHAGSK